MLKTEKEIYLIRHGEIDNPQNIYYGWQPLPLSEKGIKQVEALAQLLRSKGVFLDVIYTSPLERAKESAQIISKVFGDVPVIEAMDLADSYIPKLEGKPLSIIESADFKNEYSPEFQSPDSESLQDVFYRAKDFLRRVRTSSEQRVIALVSHGDQIRFMLYSLQYPESSGPDPQNIRDDDYPQNAEAIRLIFDGEGKFLGFEHIRREKENNIETLGDRLKEV